ncbi:MAG: heme-binding protein, partial [Candidatus Dadabacteria bacterium]|nr:heme-binding protein [Candidatus Dadabacteria bacterium]
NPPVTSDIKTPSHVKKVFKRACYDCHSNESTWPWYSKVAPSSWFVINHVNEAREEFNFSTWDKYSLEKESEIIEEIWEEVDEGKMPLWSYIILHPDARLSEEDKKVIYNWAK